MPPSLIHGRRPLLLAGVFFVPLREPEGFHLRAFSRSRRFRAFVSSVVRLLFRHLLLLSDVGVSECGARNVLNLLVGMLYSEAIGF